MTEKPITSKTIVVVATLDTRGDEVQLLKEIIEEKGHRVITVDTGVMGIPLFAGDVSREEVAGAGGKSLDRLIEEANAGEDRKAATDVMSAGARKVVLDLLESGRLDGIMSLGGSTAAASGVAIMKGMPIGLPKLIITTFISLIPVGDEDITVMQSPVDLVGLNKIVARTLANAAGALVGMVEQGVPKRAEHKLVGITALGVTTPAVQKVISRLEARGLDSLVFHATTAKLDRMARDGIIDSIVDLTAFETVPKTCWSDETIVKLSGTTEVDRTRLTCADERSIPQVIAPGGLDMHIIPGATSIDSVPDELKGRAWTMHGPYIVLVRTTADELKRVGEAIAQRANRAAGPTAVVIPLRGFSEASKKDAPLYDPEADRAFIDALKGAVDKKVTVREVDCHINDEEFADETIRTFDEITASGR